MLHIAIAETKTLRVLGTKYAVTSQWMRSYCMVLDGVKEFYAGKRYIDSVSIVTDPAECNPCQRWHYGYKLLMGTLFITLSPTTHRNSPQLTCGRGPEEAPSDQCPTDLHTARVKVF